MRDAVSKGMAAKGLASEPASAEPAPRSWLRWTLGWVVAPGAVIAIIVLLGVHVGANHPELWLVRALRWALG